MKGRESYTARNGAPLLPRAAQPARRLFFAMRAAHVAFDIIESV